MVDFREQIIGVKALARNVFRFTLKGDKDALFPWSFPSIKELGRLTNEQIDSALTMCPLTSRQQSKIRLGYRELQLECDRQAMENDPAEKQTIAMLKQVYRLMTFAKNAERAYDRAMHEKYVKWLAERKE